MIKMSVENAEVANHSSSVSKVRIRVEKTSISNVEVFVKSELIKETESHLGENGLEKAFLCKVK